MRFGRLFVIVFACMLMHTVYAGPAFCEVIDRTVATVNGEIILYSDVQAQLLLIEKMMPQIKTADPAKKAEWEREALNQIIHQHLAEQEIKKQKISVTEAEVDMMVENLMQQNHLNKEQFEAAVLKGGQSVKQFREGMKKDLERKKLVDRVLKTKTVISDQQVDAALKGEGGATLSTGKRLHLGIIFLPEDSKGGQEAEKKGRDILDKLKGGADFGKMAKENSKGPAVEDGGDIGFISQVDLAPHIAKAIDGLQKGQLSSLVRGEGGYYIVKVFDIELQKQSTGNAELREKVRRELFQREVDRKLEEWVKSLESKAFIEITL